MLLRAAVDGAELQKQVAAAERLQRGGLPTIAPMLDGWDMAGWTAQADQVGGAFHDWFCLPNGLLAAAVGRAAEQGIAGALTANTVKTALRSHAPISPPARTRAAASQSDALDRLGRRSTRHAVAGAAGNGQGTGLLLVGGPAFGGAAPGRRLAVAGPEFDHAGRKSRGRSSSDSAASCSPARRWRSSPTVSATPRTPRAVPSARQALPMPCKASSTFRPPSWSPPSRPLSTPTPPPRPTTVRSW